ncbi:hypothetical protein IC235_08365 [Hymenobacter sp. BT664]|uniref:Uncharacterized protein n=1 Tax=Hymenobacter montanus TaxID=2771359 RepID=A0A927GJA3_9BACT|nr:hypothetical protein [Hymenobacter montanus]MBD2767906.1 hypothetical protein [Hymenobacter montanus]
MSKLIADELVNSIQIQPRDVEGSLRLLDIKGSEEVLVITSTLGFFSLSEMLYVASGVHDREGIGIDNTGFRYPTDELDPGQEPLEGVEIYNPLGEVQVPILAFEHLMARYLRALITEAKKRNDSVIQQSWWCEFVMTTQQIEERLRQGE